MARLVIPALATCALAACTIPSPTQPPLERLTARDWSVVVEGVVVEVTETLDTVPLAAIPYYVSGWPVSPPWRFCIDAVCFAGQAPPRQHVGFTDAQGRYRVTVPAVLCPMARVSAERFIQTPILEADSIRRSGAERAIPDEACDGKTTRVEGPTLVLGPAVCIQSCRHGPEE